jgi:hypothetical protein
MIVARFTSVTGWAGRSITYDNGWFTLEGHGPVAVQDVLRYDQLGQIEWEYDGLRDWAAQVAAGATGYSGGVAYPAAVPYPVAAQYAAVTAPLSPPGIAIAGFVLAIAGFIVPFGVLWWVGLGLSWTGYAQAVRERLPTGLALAGLIVNAVMTVLSVVFLLIFIVVLMPIT